MQSGVYWQITYCLPYKPCHLSVSCYLKHCESYVNSGYIVLYREQQEQKCMFKTDSVFKTYFACEVGHFHRSRTHGRIWKLAVLIPALTIGREWEKPKPPASGEASASAIGVSVFSRALFATFMSCSCTPILSP